MSYAAPIIHHDFTSSVNKGTLAGKFNITSFNANNMTTNHKQVGTTSMYTGEYGKQPVVIGDTTANSFTSGTGFFVSYWYKHGYTLIGPNYYTKKTKTQLKTDAGYTEPSFQYTTYNGSDATAYVNSVSDRALGLVNQMNVAINRNSGTDILYGYNKFETGDHNSTNKANNTIGLLLWGGSADTYDQTFPTNAVSRADNSVTGSVGVFDGGDDFHHTVLSYFNNTVNIYIDGNLKTSYTHANATYKYNATQYYKFTVGNASLDTYYNDFKVYNYQADATIVDMLYKLGSNTNVSTLSGQSLSNLQNAGATIPQLLEANISLTELINAGITLQDMVDAGVTTIQLLNAGYSISELLEADIVIDWLYFTEGSNKLTQTYVNNFVDVSGMMVIRNNNNVIMKGNLTVDGIINTAAGSNTNFTRSMNLQSRLFTNNNVTVNGNLYLGGDLSVNGQFSSNFADGVIPSDAVLFASSGADIQGNVSILGDVSFNGSSVELSSSTELQTTGSITFSDGSKIHSYDDNILSGSYATNNVIYKDSLFSAVTVNGNVYIGGSLYTSSDYRIKTDVATLDGSYTVDALNPVQYNNTLTCGHEYGFIAHELQEAYPDMVVGEKDGEKYQSVMYTNLIGVMVKEVQELKHRMDKLETAK